MEVDNAIDTLVFILQVHKIADRAKIIPEMKIPGRLHTGKDPIHLFSPLSICGRVMALTR